jgi:hypothetical protein
VRLLSVLWWVLLNLVALAIALAAYRVTRSEFEVVVISGLTLIYASVEVSFALLGRAMAEGNHTRALQFVKTAELLNDPAVEDYRDGLKEQAEELRKTHVTYWINVVGTLIMSLLAIWRLVGAVV